MNRSGFIILALVLLQEISPAAPAGLVHHWNFDEGPDWHDSAYQAAHSGTAAYDSQGEAHATLQNMVAANWISGRQFTGLDFNGTDQHLTLAADLASVLGGSASLTFWLNTTQTGAETPIAAPGIAGTAGFGGAQWGWLDPSGRIGLGLDGVSAVLSSVSVSDGDWHHVAITRDAATGAVQVYVDGVLSATAAAATGMRGNAFASLGRIEGAGYFRGRLDQVTVFNRVITAGEVATQLSNHAPKSWNINSDGVSNRPFTTPSVFSRAFDWERDTLAVASWTAPAHGAVVHNGDGSFTFTPIAGYIGDDSFGVTIEDGQGGYHRSKIDLKIIGEPVGGYNLPVINFTDCAPLQAGGVDMLHSGLRVPRAVDWDADGKQDILIGAGGYIWRYLNIGTPQAPVFSTAVKVQANGVDIYAGSNSNSPLALADMTGDGVPDLIMADSVAKLRLYRNTASAGAAPVYAAHTFIKRADGVTDFVLPDKRFDIGNYDSDGLPDLITGTYTGDVKIHLNVHTAAAPRFEASSALFRQSYNVYPRFCDLGSNGQTDLVRGFNLGDVKYWNDVQVNGVSGGRFLRITDSTGTVPDFHHLTDGPIPDFADFNGDGKTDILLGGHNSGADRKIYLAYGVRESVAESIAKIEAIYDANLAGLGAALSANGDALLSQVNSANLNLIRYLQEGTLGNREAVFTALATHIDKYPFLKYQELDTAVYHHVPSIVLQNWVILGYLLPDTPARRIAVADVMGLTGTARQIYLECGLALGDNGKSIPVAYDAIRDFMRRHPRETFPDSILTFDLIYGDQKGGFVWSPNSSKNTFGQRILGSDNHWAGDLTEAIEKVLGPGSASGDFFSLVMGHEVTHSLDRYVRSRANLDLQRRWGQRMVYAAGPDVRAGSNGWFSMPATQANFEASGLYAPATQTWAEAWSGYWTTGPGAVFSSLSSMRMSINVFLGSPQESLATQGNHHWANGPGRLIGALDRFRRAEIQGLEPMKANMTEVVDFIDYISLGMNRVNLVETKYQGGSVVYFDHLADLVRDDDGRIIRLTVDGDIYHFTVDATGIIRDVSSTVTYLLPGSAAAISGHGQVLRVLQNGLRYDGSPLSLSSFTQPAHGSIINDGDGTLIYRSTSGYTGSDSFTYQTAGKTGTVMLNVVGTSIGVLQETWQNISGKTVAHLTGNARFPGSPDNTVLIATHESPSNRGENFGTRARSWVTPTQSGDYTFWIAADDSCELWMSTDSSSANKALIASATSATFRQWTAYPSQQSAVRSLVAGQRYYIEALHKEGSGGDYLAVAWSGPGITQQVIGSEFLTAYQLNHDPAVFADSAVTHFNTGISIPVLANDSDVDSDRLIIRSITQPANGTAAITGTSILYTPAANHSGSDSFTCTVSDEQGGIVTTAVDLTVLTPLESWRQTHFGTTSNSGITADTADKDFDGLLNLLEYACATNPNSASVTPQSASLEGSAIDFVYTRNKTAIDIACIVEWSDTLGNDWDTSGVSAPSILSDDGTTERIKVTVPAGSGIQRRFVRLKVMRQSN